MPIYEYKCENCGSEFELFRNISATDEPVCTSCNGPVRKLISRSSFHLKGTGWYVTDYARKGGASSSTSEPKETKSTTDDSSKKSTSTDTSSSGD